MNLAIEKAENGYILRQARYGLEGGTVRIFSDLRSLFQYLLSELEDNSYGKVSIEQEEKE